MTRPDYSRLTDSVYQPHAASLAELVAVLRRELARARLFDSHDIPPHVVTMNSRIKLRKMRSDEELHFTLVYPPAVDAAQGRLSVLSPIGLAVLLTG